MNDILSSCLEQLQLGSPQHFQGMSVVPLSSTRGGGPKYLTLTQALAEAFLHVTEVDAGGSVPELKVINEAGMSVLLIDGEELSGAKQNRILNTTILLKKHSETIVPVSCTEQGRWSYVSPEFGDSGVVMHRQARARKSRSVSASLGRGEAYASDQGEVWESIAELHACAGTASPTRALRDVFEQRSTQIDAYLSHFPIQPDQAGMAVLLNGRVAGLDVVSRPSAYADLHAKLVKSYAIEANVQPPGEASGIGTVKDGGKGAGQQASDFLAAIRQLSGKRFKSVGHGWDFRYAEAEVVGSSLQYRGAVIHAAFFTEHGGQARSPRFAAFSRRRAYRRTQ